MFGPTLGPLVPPLYRSVEVGDNATAAGGALSTHPGIPGIVRV